MRLKLHVKDLKQYLTVQGISAEKFASQVQLSHMTIRRWLKKRDDDAIPEKYYPLLAPLLAQPGAFAAGSAESFDIENLMKEVEALGKDFHDLEGLDRDIRQKTASTRVDKKLLDYCKQLLTALRSNRAPLKARAIAIGALIYFVTPLDLIPDHIPIIGFVDDLAVLSIAINAINGTETELMAEAPQLG